MTCPNQSWLNSFSSSLCSHCQAQYFSALRITWDAGLNADPWAFSTDGNFWSLGSGVYFLPRMLGDSLEDYRVQGERQINLQMCIVS